MTPRLVVGILLAALAVPAHAPGVGASAAQELTLDVPLGEHGWAALRLNLTPGSDLQVDASWQGCRTTEEDARAVIGVAWFLIQDGDPRLHLLAPGAMAWNGDSLSAGAAGTTVRSPALLAQPSCDASSVVVGAEGAASRSLTLLVVSLAPAGHASMRATWTTGVVSHDLAQGSALAKTKDGFEEGAHATAYPTTRAAGAGALLRQQVHVQRDHVGWFWPKPDPQGAGAIRWSCSSSVGPCPGADAAGLVQTSSKGPATWDFRIEADLAVREGPFYALGAVELPDDSYLG